MTRSIASTIGNFLEHYDHALFGFLAPFLAPHLFPESGPLEALIYTYALIPLGVLSRPLGALLFGWMGDRWGRKRTLSITLIGMALATGAMGFLPSDAPLLWGLMRLIQNFFSIGEVTGGAIYLLEGKSPQNRSFWSSLYDASGILGILTASGAAALSFSFHFHWKWLFFAGFLTALSGVWIRLTGDQDEEKRFPERLFPALKNHWKETASIATVSGFSYANYYMVTTFLNGFLPLVTSMTREEILAMNTLLLFGDFLLLPLFGWIGGKIGKEKLMLGAVLIGVGASVFLIQGTVGASPIAIFAIRLAMACVGIAFAAPYYAWSMDIAPKANRYLICGLGTAIGSRLLGAPVPAMGLWLYQQTHSAGTTALPLLAIALLAAGALILQFSMRKKIELL